MKRCFYLITLVFLTSCNFTDKSIDKPWSDLPEVTSLDSLKLTEFAVTMESTIRENVNTIYAPAFLFAWDEIEEELKSPIKLDNTNSEDIKFLLASSSHVNSLVDNEYSASASVANGEIVARAFFNKTLPFETKLQLLEDPIYFNKQSKVEAFGMKYLEADIIKSTKILYYLNDDNFILKLIPKDKLHEIILIKGLQTYKTLTDALIQVRTLIEKGEIESKNSELMWKYEIIEQDIFSIPTIKFNIATKYENLEGQKFLTKDNRKHFIAEAYQRTGFILNENGAVVESEVFAAVDSIGDEPAEPIIKHVKNMVFDKPFLIVIKRQEQKNPYFVMAVNNTELMTKK